MKSDLTDSVKLSHSSIIYVVARLELHRKGQMFVMRQRCRLKETQNDTNKRQTLKECCNIHKCAC